MLALYQMRCMLLVACRSCGTGALVVLARLFPSPLPGCCHAVRACADISVLSIGCPPNIWPTELARDFPYYQASSNGFTCYNCFQPRWYSSYYTACPKYDCSKKEAVEREWAYLKANCSGSGKEACMSPGCRTSYSYVKTHMGKSLRCFQDAGALQRDVLATMHLPSCSCVSSGHRASALQGMRWQRNRALVRHTEQCTSRLRHSASDTAACLQAGRAT
jgi:hypothetical protein